MKTDLYNFRADLILLNNAMHQTRYPEFFNPGYNFSGVFDQELTNSFDKFAKDMWVAEKMGVFLTPPQFLHGI